MKKYFIVLGVSASIFAIVFTIKLFPDEEINKNPEIRKGVNKNPEIRKGVNKEPEIRSSTTEVIEGENGRIEVKKEKYITTYTFPDGSTTVVPHGEEDTVLEKIGTYTYSGR